MNGLTCAVKPKKATTARQTVVLVFVLIFLLYRYTRTAPLHRQTSRRHVSTSVPTVKTSAKQHVRGQRSLQSHPLVLFESRHDQYAKTTGHFIERFYSGQWPSEEHMQTILFDVLVYARNFCRRYSIPFQLYAGTLLGAWRHHAIIPWDVDVDVLITSAHSQALIAVLHNFAGESSTTYQWIVRSGKDSDIIAVKLAHIATGLYVDFFVIYPAGVFWRDAWQKRKPHDALFPSRPCVFGTRHRRAIFDCPNDARIMLSQYSTLDISTKDRKKFPFVVEFDEPAESLAEARDRLKRAKRSTVCLNQTDWSYYLRDSLVPR